MSLFLRESLAIREKTQPDAWTTFDSKSLLGGALLGQKKVADAEPLLLAGYEGMKKRENATAPRAAKGSVNGCPILGTSPRSSLPGEA